MEFYGAGGISVPLSLLAQHRFLSLGPCAAHALPEAQLHAAALLETGCVAVGIAHYGAPAQVVEVIERAREVRATTISITNAPRSPVAMASEITLLTASHENVPMSDAVSSRVPLCP